MPRFSAGDTVYNRSSKCSEIVTRIINEKSALYDFDVYETDRTEFLIDTTRNLSLLNRANVKYENISGRGTYLIIFTIVAILFGFKLFLECR